jgi:hypothetical protein
LARSNFLILTLVCWLAAAPLRAQPADPNAPLVQAGPVPNTYALLIGSNPGGEGQVPLRYAEQDAQRMAAVLKELGRYSEAKTQVLLGPDKKAVLGALRGLRDTLQAHQDKGEQAQLVFYYSGHARSNGLYLGREELPLAELRERVLELPTTLKVVVLDACQSGAFSRVKGTQPSAAFSHNSIERLQTNGVAIMASSTASELSQESEALGGSYFTHHLVVGLRGAGDLDHDGIVSLAEAYRYAYDATLLATARTAVGEQHVTLETSLSGQGDVPLTYPAEAGAQLELPAELDADVLVQRDSTVIAELHKAAGRPLRLALSAGNYVAVLRRGPALAECQAVLVDKQVTRLVVASCSAITEDQARAKGYDALAGLSEPPREEWGFELHFGLGGFTHDDYTQRLEDFGFAEQIGAKGSPLRLALAASLQLTPHLSVVGDFRNFDAGHFERDLQSTRDERVIEKFDWSSFALSGHLRAHLDVFGRDLRLYSQLGLGLGVVDSKLDDHKETHVGPVLTGSAGVFYMPWYDFGFAFQATYAYAPILGNNLDETHDSGGVSLTLGVRIRTWSTP